jgi:hypothetical protein
MKFIKCMYTSFDDSKLEVSWKKGDVVALTPKLAKAQVILDGINTRNFVFVDVNNLTELSKVVNLTDSIRKAFKQRMVEERTARVEAAEAAEEAAKPKTHPVPEDKGVKPTPKEEEKTPEQSPEEDEKTEEKQPAEGEGESEGDQAEEEGPVLAFTEDAGNVGAAIQAVEKETDLKKLKYALEKDERVSVRKAIEARLVELKAAE